MDGANWKLAVSLCVFVFCAVLVVECFRCTCRSCRHVCDAASGLQHSALLT